MAGGSGADNGPIGFLLSLLENRVILAFLAILAGLGGGLGSRQVVDPRPDPYTGSQGRLAEDRILSLEHGMITALRDIERMREDHRRCIALSLRAFEDESAHRKTIEPFFP